MKSDNLVTVAFQNVFSAQCTGCGGSQHRHGHRNPLRFLQVAGEVLNHSTNRAGSVLQNLFAEKVQALKIRDRMHNG
jgi:hypothetical protein